MCRIGILQKESEGNPMEITIIDTETGKPFVTDCAGTITANEMVTQLNEMHGEGRFVWIKTESAPTWLR